jgi:hypothetical protein
MSRKINDFYTSFNINNIKTEASKKDEYDDSKLFQKKSPLNKSGLFGDRTQGSKILKEINSFNKSMNRTPSVSHHINRPLVLLGKKPELEIKKIDYMKFSPIDVRRNYLVTSQSVKTGIPNQFNRTQPQQQKKTFINLDFSNKQQRKREESPEDFERELTSVKRYSFIEKFSPKKKMKQNEK